MKLQTLRSALLFVILAGTLAVRWFDPLGTASATLEDAQVSQPVQRAHTSSNVAPPTTRPSPLGWPVREAASGPSGDAFMAKGLTSGLPAMPAVHMPAPVVAPAPPIFTPEPVVAPAPVQVIGTWQDGNAQQVFLSAPTGTLLAKVGDVILSDYTVVAMDDKTLTLQHLHSKQVWSLQIPGPQN